MSSLDISYLEEFIPLLGEAGNSVPEGVDLGHKKVVLRDELFPLSNHLKSNQAFISVTRDVDVVKRMRKMTVFVKVFVTL